MKNLGSVCSGVLVLRMAGANRHGIYCIYVTFSWTIDDNLWPYEELVNSLVLVFLFR